MENQRRYSHKEMLKVEKEKRDENEQNVANVN